MSIYGSTWGLDADDHADTCDRWVRCDCPNGLDHHHHAMTSWLDLTAKEPA